MPTHLSNLDSIVFGYALERAGLPPATYGAGKNLFTNPVLSYFMHNLGAYRVDRRIRHNLYKDVLKTYSCVLLERGYHSLFFPGGTRSRSGGVERRLKLGLVGTRDRGVRAHAASPGSERRVFFVPATINYLITLEAETLIDDFLSEAGKGRYIIEDDESTRLGAHRVVRAASCSTWRARCVIRFGEPIDPFGNRVDEEGRSHDARGREVDPASYVKDRDGEVAHRCGARRAVHARARRGDLSGLRARHGGDGDARRRRGVLRAPAARRRRRGDLFTVLRQRDASSVPRDELAADVRRPARSAARARAARRRRRRPTAPHAPRAATSSSAPCARSPATTRAPVLALAARTASRSATPTSSSITRTASRPTASPGT